MTPPKPFADPAQNALSLTHIVPQNAASKWRTEAMRSYSSPRLIFFTKGQGRITVSGLTSGYGANNLIYVPANTLFGYEAGTTVFGYVIAIPRALAHEWPEEPLHLRMRDVLIQKEFVSTLDSLEREMKSGRAGHERAAHHMLGIMSVFFQRQLEDNPPVDTTGRTTSSAARLVAAFTDLLERGFSTGKGVTAYARELGVTPTHLTRCCNQTCGKSALAIINDRILFEARERLRTSKTPVKTIASDLGFSSAAYFTRSFQHETGMTPSAFRKAH